MHPLKQYLQDVDEKVQDFARRIGASRQTLYRIFAGIQTPKPVLARRIAEATGGAVTLEMLYIGKAEGFSDLSMYLARQHCETVLDEERARLALMMTISQLCNEGAPEPGSAILGHAAKASVEIFAAMAPMTACGGDVHIARAFRLPLECILQKSGASLSSAALDEGAELAAALYAQLGELQEKERNRSPHND